MLPLKLGHISHCASIGELRELYTEWVTSDEKLEEIAGLMATRRELEAKRDKTDRTEQRQKERAAMGQWIADYLDDAGGRRPGRGQLPRGCDRRRLS